MPSRILRAHVNQFIMRNVTADCDKRAFNTSILLLMEETELVSGGHWVDQALGSAKFQVVPSPAKPPELTTQPGVSP